jgi:hypothetical protein
MASTPESSAAATVLEKSSSISCREGGMAALWAIGSRSPLRRSCR